MNKTLSNFIFACIIGLVFVNCANRGTPSGGPKDETPPSILKSEPENYSTNFKGKEIKVYFDEYIKIKDLSKQLIISPPMKTQPIVTPLGGASKYISIKISDTLQPNTTYAFKPGKYLLTALKDGNGDNKFQQKTDQIAYYKNFIEVPSDSSYTLKLFEEDLDFKSTRPRLISGEKIAFGYEGDYQDMNIKILSETPAEFEYRITKDQKTDSLNYWYKPRMDVDSLIFKVTRNDFEKEYTARISEQKRDSLRIEVSPSGTIGYTEDFKITDVSFNYPINGQTRQG